MPYYFKDQLDPNNYISGSGVVIINYPSGMAASTGNIKLFLPSGGGVLALVSQISNSGTSLGYGDFSGTNPITYTTGVFGLNTGSSVFKLGVEAAISVSGGLLTYDNTSGLIGLASGIISTLLPLQTSNSGKSLTTNGKTLLWNASTGASTYASLTDVTLTSVASGDIPRYDGTVWRNINNNNQRYRTIVGAFQGNPVVSGMYSTPYKVPYDGTITKATILGNVTGSIKCDIVKGTYTNYPTMTSICSGTLPNILNSTKNQDTTLTGWTSGVVAEDVFQFIVTSGNNLITRLSVILDVLVN